MGATKLPICRLREVTLSANIKMRLKKADVNAVKFYAVNFRVGSKREQFIQ
jgi:hypothetical protein